MYSSAPVDLQCLIDQLHQNDMITVAKIEEHFAQTSAYLKQHQQGLGTQLRQLQIAGEGIKSVKMESSSDIAKYIKSCKMPLSVTLFCALLLRNLTRSWQLQLTKTWHCWLS